MDKKVSVVMCTYNGAKYLKEQLDSILEQTYPIYELIIQDDCSTDGTWELLEKYRSGDSRVKVYRNKKRLGFNANFNSALSLPISGDYIALSDQDDIWRHDKIEVLLKNISESALIFHESLLFKDSIEHLIGCAQGEQANVHETYLLMKSCVLGHECVFKKDIVPTIVKLTSKEPTISFDYLTSLVGSVYGGCRYLNEGLTYWRRHEAAATYVKKPSPPVTGIHGIIKALMVLGNKEKRAKAQRYFQLVAQLDFKEPAAKQITNCMKSNKVLDIVRACFICYKYRSLFTPPQK